MKIACIYHSIDLDGWMSAAIVKHWFNKQEVPNKDGEDCNTINFIGYNYGQPIPDLSEYDKVIMCDISFPLIDMLEISDRLTDTETLETNFIWLDHHVSAIKSNISVEADGVRNTNFAACELTWMYFFPSFSSKSQWEGMPEIVRLLGRYDCFGHKGTDEETKVLEFQYGARQCISNYEEAYTELTKDDSNTIGELTNLERIHRQGKAIYQYLCTEAKQSYKNGFNIYFELNPCEVNNNVKKFICINKERFNPINFGIDYHKDGYDGAACFYLNKDNKWSFSLYNDNGLVDCSQIAKQYGGGGHKGAAGMIVNLETFKSIVQL